jgi:hypothetical protein
LRSFEKERMVWWMTGPGWLARGWTTVSPVAVLRRLSGELVY